MSTTPGSTPAYLDDVVDPLINFRADSVSRYDRFIAEYIANGRNAEAAARVSHPDARDHAATARYLLSLSYVQQQTSDIVRAKFEELDIRAERVLLELYHKATANMADYGFIEADGRFIVDLTRCSRDQMSCVQEIGYDREGRMEIKLYSALEAKKLLGSYFKLFVNQHEVFGPGGAPLAPPNLTVRFIKRSGEE